MKESENTKYYDAKTRIVVAIVHYSVNRGGYDDLQTVTLTLRSLYEVAAIPDHIEDIAQINIESDYVSVTSMHIYDDIVPQGSTQFSLFN